MNTFKVTYKPFGDKAILIEWEKRVDSTLLNHMIDFKDSIMDCDYFELIDLVMGYHSLTLVFRRQIKDFDTTVSQLKKVRSFHRISKKTTKTLWKIPVCYDSKFGIDLAEMSQDKNIPVEKIIQLHTEVVYTVFFIGFLPGFLYLGGLDEKLYTRRKSSPRLRVAKGAVAIGGSQTGVYPMESPGGWNIIGNTPVSFFELNKETPCFAKSGDGLQFYSITEKEYSNIQCQIASGSYQINKEFL